MNRLINLSFCVLLVLWITQPVAAQVKYDEGRRMINGVQLLQDYSDPQKYFYLPQYPRLATKDDGTFEFLCIKYVGEVDASNGGLFHALVAFDLPDEVVEVLQRELENEIPGAHIAGPVPLLEAFDEDEGVSGSFELVSAVLSNTGDEDSFTHSVLASNHAPLMPGSRAAVAAKLNQEGATLLWDSMTGPTSDISVSIHGYYEAIIKGYNAVVTAEMETLYEHFSRVTNIQEGSSRFQERDIKDELQRNGLLNVEVLDRAASTGVSSADMEAILNLATDKLTELMFDADAGWSTDPERETAVEKDQILGRQNRGWLDRLFRGDSERAYFPDNQFVLKKREDIRSQRFSLNLNKSTTIKVPFHSSGNLGGLFNALGDDERYFRIIDLNDTAFQKRDVHFQIDGSYIDSFEDLINFASVSFRKIYDDNPAVTNELFFNHVDVKQGLTMQQVAFPRLGIEGSEWLDYEYRIQWHLKDGATSVLHIPAKEDAWISSSDPAVAITPPFRKRVVEIDADRSLFTEAGVATAIVEFATDLGGAPRLMRSVTLRAGDTDPTSKVSVYHDEDAPVAYRVTWHSAEGRVRSPLALLDSDYLFLVPPSSNAVGGGDQ